MITQEKQTLSFSEIAEDSGEWTEFSYRAELKTITDLGDRNRSKLSKNDCNGDSFIDSAMIKLLWTQLFINKNIHFLFSEATISRGRY